jgi:hypothetical protein
VGLPPSVPVLQCGLIGVAIVPSPSGGHVQELDDHRAFDGFSFEMVHRAIDGEGLQGMTFRRRGRLRPVLGKRLGVDGLLADHDKIN